MKSGLACCTVLLAAAAGPATGQEIGPPSMASPLTKALYLLHSWPD
jgi:hypothetical protein